MERAPDPMLATRVAVLFPRVYSETARPETKNRCLAPATSEALKR
jgi:hypothetical protein